MPFLLNKSNPYQTPRNFGLSPGAEHSDSLFKDITCVMDRTVSVTYHGNPRIEQTTTRDATKNRSKWYPCPFYNNKILNVPSAQLNAGKNSAFQNSITGLVGSIKEWTHTTNLFSFLLIMTSVICWSINSNMVARRAGIMAAKTSHHGLCSTGSTIHGRFTSVG